MARRKKKATRRNPGFSMRGKGGAAVGTALGMWLNSPGAVKLLGATGAQYAPLASLALGKLVKGTGKAAKTAAMVSSMERLSKHYGWFS